jgi:hypothetical protein
MGMEAVRKEQCATLRTAAESWERARTLREDVGYEEGMRRKRTFEAYARADFVLWMLNEVERLRALATGAPPRKSLPSRQESTPKGGTMAGKAKDTTKKRSGTKKTARKSAPKTARAKAGTKRGAKKAATT